MANRGFYLMVFVTLMAVFLVIWLTRWLDYWEILPNEILHHHGPLSDLERYPTMNLKFDKEIPDVLEFLLLGAGRLVLHVTKDAKAIVLDNVLFISRKEEALKRLMSRLEVRVTTDQEAGEGRAIRKAKARAGLPPARAASPSRAVRGGDGRGASAAARPRDSPWPGRRP